MPQIDDRHVPWIFVAILVSLVSLNVQGAMLLMRKQGTATVWVENDTWLKTDDRRESFGVNEQIAAGVVVEDAIRTVLNQCRITTDALGRMEVFCLDIAPKAPAPPLWPLPSGPKN